MNAIRRSLDADKFAKLLDASRIEVTSGVPCSIFSGLIERLEADENIRYIHASREDEGLAIASGARLGGMRGAVLLQNSGLGSIINPLASLNLLYRIPVLLLISWRGYQGKDAPEHLIMGATTERILDILDIPFMVPERDSLEKALTEILDKMEDTGLPVALIIKRGVLE